ncbi:MAG: hypothetical protein LN563_01885 [Rickettsia endosymbiont of Platyusa sonomae]|nr:hypothetical protein [Rickettsia endosymbiont of Platyusa sonomae]
MTIDFNAHVEGNCLNFEDEGTTLSEILSSDDNLNKFSSFINANPNITALNLDNCNIDIGKIKLLIKPINNSNITDLDVSCNEITAEGATEIAKLTNLATLNIEYNKITDVGATTIATMPNLTHLRIDGGNITDIGATAIATMLNLAYLDIRYNKITDVGVTAIADMPNLTSLDIHINKIIDKWGAIAKALKDNTILTSLGIQGIESDIQKILERNKNTKDISEAFKPIISKMTLDTDGTPLVFLDKEDSEQNSFLNKLNGYSEKYGELFLPALEQSIAQSLYQDTVHVHKDETEQLSFASRSDALTKVTQTILECLGFKEDKINEFNSKIVEIIKEVEEMFLLELDISNNNMVGTWEINTKTEEFDSTSSLPFLFYHEFTVGDTWLPFPNMNAELPDVLQKADESQEVELKNNQQLTDLYEKHPELKMPGTILRDFLKSDSTVYLNTARELKQHADGQTFKHKPLIQKLLNDFIKFNKISETELQESPLAPKQKASLKTPLAQHSDSHLPNISEHTSIGLATDDLTPILGDSSYHTTDTGCIS